MCDCDGFKTTKIRVRSVRKMYPDANIKVLRREVIDGALVALVELTFDGQREEHLFCAADMVWTRKNIRTPGGVKYTSRVVRDTFKCPRKAKFAKLVQGEVATSLMGLVRDPRDIILELFTRTRKGGYAGQGNGGPLYVQHIAGVMQKCYGSFAGIPLASTYRTLDERKAHLREIIVYALCCDIKLEHWGNLSDAQILDLAFFVDTLSLVTELRDARAIGLNGMIITQAPPQDISDAKRVPMQEGDPMFVGSMQRDNLVFQVQRKYVGGATACVFRYYTDGSVALLATHVTVLMYDAQFGLDVEDMARFERMFERFIKTGLLSEET